jgi:hypothetical protein
MLFLYAYLRAACTASACIVALTLATTLSGVFKSSYRLSAEEVRTSLPSTLLFLVLLTSVFTLVLGAFGHWFLSNTGASKRLHYLTAGSALGLAVAVLFLHDAPWPTLAVDGPAFAMAGGAAANSFWKLYVRGA